VPVYNIKFNSTPEIFCKDYVLGRPDRDCESLAVENLIIYWPLLCFMTLQINFY
jgi:hypothetical protein